MIKMKIIGTAALPTSSFISLPDFKLDTCRYYSLVREVVRNGLLSLFVSDLELELENFATVCIFLPSIDELEYAIVCPNAISDLFIDSYQFGLCGASLESVSRLEEETVLSWFATRCKGWLVQGFRIYLGRGFGNVVALVVENPTISLHSVCVRSTPADTHKDYRHLPLEPEIHAALKIDPLSCTHLDVGEHIAGFELLSSHSI